jgi:excisionase family DNA binding protein
MASTIVPPEIRAAAEQPVMIDVCAVARMCDVSTRHIRRMADAGRMPAPRRLGGAIRWVRAEIEKWIADGCRPVRQGGR